MNRILVFMYCVHTVTVAGLPDKIYWTIKDLPSCPLINGGSIKLFCNTSAVGLQKATWMKQSDVILHNGFSFTPDKYIGKDINDGSFLTIMNTTESDFNSSYTCLSDVHSYEDVLMANSSNFICMPQNTNITWTIIGRNVSVQLKLERFFPVPKCRTMFGGYMLKMTQQESVHLQNGFYHGTLNITSKSAHDLCGGNLTVVCLFGSVYPDTIETKILQNCYGN
ncbi:unnamed protein product [Mytilus coruscus]|uniref:Ig-like domain-containing protein n=1 Tax=Mytilus coruscus TaxID=42192 RepID=A0A6J8CWL0_MYTCO|nr:unnamed protein product [Mytilus coruscus]